MSDSIVEPPDPSFVFVCGAVGSGNTFMFRCLSQDQNVYGVNEVDLGRLLDRLIRSEKLGSKCPHSLDAYVKFMLALKGNRRTLLEKNPANIRYKATLKKYLPNSRFIAMLREPHAAIVSGLDGRSIVSTPESVARLWLSDFELVVQPDTDAIVVFYDHFVTNPAPILAAIAERIMPVSSDVYTFANRMIHPDRSAQDRWHQKVDAGTGNEIKDWVSRLGLDKLYRDALLRSDAATNGSFDGESWQESQNTVTKAKRLFFKAWYKFRT